MTAHPEEDLRGEQAGAPSAGAGPRSVRGSRLAGWSVVAVLVAVLVVALVAVAGWAAWRLRADAQLSAARADATTVARSAVPDLLSYDYRSLDADLARGGKGLTPAFAAEYAEVADQSVRPVAVQDQVVTTASVPAASVVTASRNQVRLLLFVNQLTSSRKTDNAISVSRVVVTMRHEAGHWLVQDLRAV